MIMNLLLKANPYKDKLGRFSSKANAATVTTLAHDSKRQAEWLTARAKELGHPDVEALAHTDMSKFFSLASQWRRTHAFKIEQLLGLTVR